MEKIISSKGRLLILFFLLFISSCNRVKERHYTKDYAVIYQRLNFFKYRSIYEIASDSIKRWNSVYWILDPKNIFNNYQLDSALVFNEDSTKLYGTINKQSIFKDADSDGSLEFYGAKINENWYFLTGASLHIPREWYQDSIYAPLTFEEISYVAHVNFTKDFLIKKPDGSIEGDSKKINQYILDPHTYGCYTCSTREQNDSLFLANVSKMHSERRSNEEIEKILEKASKTVRPPEPSQERNWWERIWHPFQPKIFGRQREDDPWK